MAFKLMTTYLNPIKLILLFTLCFNSYAIARCDECLRDKKGRIARSLEAKKEFKLLNPCPSNRLRFGSCPGYVIDHIEALACGGADAADNMQWQTKAEAKAKDKWERKGC